MIPLMILELSLLLRNDWRASIDYRHSKYLYSHLVVMAPGSDKGDRRKAIAEAMMAVKEEFYVKKVKKDYSKFDVLKVWPEGESRPPLAKFVNKDSWLMFFLLDLRRS